jgi:hypothetical protein
MRFHTATMLLLATFGPAMAGSVLPLAAQDNLPIDQTKLYVTEPSACQALEKQDVDAWLEQDFLALSFASGIQSMEFHCNFYDVKARPNSPLLFVDAVCELPGALYPDMLAIAPNGPDSILVVSGSETTLALASSDAPPSDNPVGTTLYYRCDNLSEIPID